MKGSASIVLLILSVLLLAAVPPGDALSCGDVSGMLYPCLQYLTNGGEPTSQCCSGVSGLTSMLQSQQDRQTACYCMKSAASGVAIRADEAANLPGKCGVSIGYTVSPTVDCSSVS